MVGKAVVAAHHNLRKVKQFFRLAKSELKARPVFHRTRESIEAYPTIVLVAPAIARPRRAANAAKHY
ncbi:transposase [Rhodococcus opacus RKJ300 = JCM 13270]|uniref:Transposase n=1 Tax=Rhodococcus opacus RKJ300 = JCM 13270 TaxID=1165867 RepID=I0WIL1_RHOOP|nr:MULTISPECIES: hypothetical protein [Rhodococcus]EID76227.1 transposase [Rhodococcus opacus RKJ300 = JCM 13270]QQZ14555.1 hypothetical protein GO592_33990 [Rhodococcus sp. 21391]